MLNKKALAIGLSVATLLGSTTYFGYDSYKTNIELDNTKRGLYIETQKNRELNKEVNSLSNELKTANKTIKDLKDTEYELVYMGDFEISYYCNEKYEHICGTSNGKTSTGNEALVGRTVAVDPNVIPYGSYVYIEGCGFRVADDCGGGVDGNHVDVLVDSHQEALSLGKDNSGVWILIKK